MFPKGVMPKEVFSKPRGIAIGPDNNFYIANGNLNRVSIFNQSWEEIGFVG
jgi:DNA-binding beta-propeller fold protein YncE